jgi:type I restriction enzyme S subunit
MREGWEKRVIDDLGYLFSGNSINKKTKEEKYTNIKDGLPYIATKDVGFDRSINYDNGIRIPESDSDQFKIAPKNTILICAEGGSAGRKIGITNQKVCLVNKLFALTVKDTIDPKYIYYFYQSEEFQFEFKSNLTGLIGGVSKSKFKNLEVPIPPLPEQKAIVKILDEAFAKIDQAKANIGKNIENSKKLFQSKLNEIFSQRGEGWEIEYLGEISEFKNGLNFSKSSKGDEIKIIGVSNFRNNFSVPFDDLDTISIDGELSDIYKLKTGDILTVRSNGNPKLIGRCILAENVNEIISHSGFTIRIRVDQSIISAKYLCHFLKSPQVKNELIKGGNGINIKSLNQKVLSSLKIKYPSSISHQNNISKQVTKISALNVEIGNVYIQKSVMLDELKKSLLQKAFSGELTKSVATA